MVNLRNALEAMPTNALQLKVETGSTNLSYFSGLFAALGGTWSKNEILAAGGLIFVALTYFTSLYFQRRRDKREQEFHHHRLLLEKEREQREIDRNEVSK